MNKNYFNLYILLILSNILICQKLNETINPINSSEYKILNIYYRKNDNKIYTQGLFFSDDKKSIYESGGLYGESRIIQLKYPSLEIIKETKMNNNYFGEGIAKCDNFIYQLTWRERKIIKYDYNTLEKINEINMDYQMKEGWGLSISNKENELFATDGSDKIFRLDCNQNLKVIDIIQIKFNEHSVKYLNDLI
jgi:glutamine cyclotransferase